MRIIENVAVAVVQGHEEATAANVRLGGYDMPIQLDEVRAYRVAVDAEDADRLFLLGLGALGVGTAGGSFKVADILPRVASLGSVRSLMRAGVDLRTRPDLSLVIVTAGDDRRPLTIIDGNHRAMAQFLTYRTVQDVSAFVCIHPGFAQWSYIPPLARCRVDP